MRHRWNSCLALAGILIAGLAGCASTPSQTSAPPVISAPIEYRVGAPDILQVIILPDPVIEREVVVRPDGFISVDLLGDVPAAGRTCEEIAADITKRIARYKLDPAVTVSVRSAQSNTVTVFGQVRAPGTYAIQHDTRVAEVIGEKGGTTIFAAKSKVRVIRFDGQTTTVTQVNMKKIKNGDLSTNVKLEGGDIVVVPPHGMARIGFALQTILFPFQLLLSSGGALALSALVL